MSIDAREGVIAPIDKDSLLRDLRNHLVEVLIFQINKGVFPEELYVDLEVKNSVADEVARLEERKKGIAQGIGGQMREQLTRQIALLKEKFEI